MKILLEVVKAFFNPLLEALIHELTKVLTAPDHVHDDPVPALSDLSGGLPACASRGALR